MSQACLDFKIVDAALWIIGSRVCSSRDYRRCTGDCVLAKESCISRIQISPKTGRYAILDSEGKRVETRKGARQGHLFFVGG